MVDDWDDPDDLDPFAREPPPVGTPVDALSILDSLARPCSRPDPDPAERDTPPGRYTERQRVQIAHLLINGLVAESALDYDPAGEFLGPLTEPRNTPDFRVVDGAVLRPASAGRVHEDKSLSFHRACAARLLWLDRTWFARLQHVTIASRADPLAYWDSHLQAMRKCPGRYGLLTTPKDRFPCGVRGACPWCWARDAVRDTRRIDRAFFVAPDGTRLPTSPHVLVQRELTVRTTTGSVIETLRQRARKNGAITRSADSAALRKATRTRANERVQCGLYERYRPILSYADSDAWVVSIRQVILLPQGVSLPPAAHGIEADVSHMVTRPSPRRVRCAMIWANRYTPFLLRSNWIHTLTAVDARTQAEASMTSGVFRASAGQGSRTTAPDASTEEVEDAEA